MKLLVRNLARDTTEADLTSLFEAHGAVQSCNLVSDASTGISKGFGFIEMPKPGEAKAAIKMLNGTDLGGNKIRVKRAETKPAGADADSNRVAQPAENQPGKAQANTPQAAPSKRLNPYAYRSREMATGESPNNPEIEPKPARHRRDWPKRRGS